MNALIRVTPMPIGRATVNAVDARELHAFLEVGRDFSSWIKERIEQYGFFAGEDFVAHEAAPQIGGAGKRGARIEYAVSLDMAKELAMVERNARGKEARQYFIECERVAKAAPAVDPLKVLNDPAAMRGLLLTYSEKVLALESQVKAAEPELRAFEEIAKAGGSVCLRGAAKVLGMKEADFLAWLFAERWIYRHPRTRAWAAFAERLSQGYLVHKVWLQPTEVGEPQRMREQVRVTPAGLTHAAKLMKSRNARTSVIAGKAMAQCAKALN